MAKRFAPLLLVLLTASLWSWTQGPRILPNRANCAVDGITLDKNIHDVYWGVGKPDKIDRYFPKTREDITVWSWPEQAAPSLKQLQVSFRHTEISAVEGSELSLGANNYRLKVGAPLSEAYFLGGPTRGDKDRVTWSYPEVTVSVSVDRSQRVTMVEIAKP